MNGKKQWIFPLGMLILCVVAFVVMLWSEDNIKKTWKEYDAQIEELSQKIDDLSDENVGLNADILEKGEEIESLNAQIDELNSTIEEKDNEIATLEQAKAEKQKSYSSSGSSSTTYQASSSSGTLTKSGGVNYYNGRTETWYSQKVLPGGGLDIPGRYVDENGLVRDGDGYICVAASDLAYGSTVETSLGTGKVYDTGCAEGVTDIYTDW